VIQAARALLIVFVVGLVLVPAANAGVIVDRAVAGLRSDPVYVDTAAERALDDAAADRLRERIANAGAGPVYVAVLPDEARIEAGGDADAVVDLVHRGLGRDGTYVALVGNRFRAGSTEFPAGVVPQLATEAFREHGNDGVEPTLLAFVDGVAAARRGEPTAAEEREESDGSSGWLLPVLVGVGAGGIGDVTLRRRRRRRAELADVKRAAQDDLLALAEDVRALDLDVEMPGVSSEARDDYGAAVAAYERADTALDRARRPEDVEAVTASIDEGRFAMASAKARLEGREPPERRPPCFFDPRHGPSTRDVEWAPPGGMPRPVPACEADALAVERGHEPAHREVEVGGRRMPYWEAGPAFAPWAGGYFGGLLPGLLIGSMLGGGLGFGYPGDAGAATSEPGDFGDGDVGGGDFGDFGGGDFGGGDFGGGDFGGGE
jgi:hypothetical protein